MALNLPLYQTMLKARDTSPYNYYKNFQQALINTRWTNTTTLVTIEEQAMIGEWQFNPIEVRLNHAISSSPKSRWQGDDVRKINFQDLDHSIRRGLYYHFDNNYYITTFIDEADRLAKDVIVRRCNNFMRWVDPNTKEVKSYPCVLAYDATSPQNQIDNDIITPNNNIAIIVQGNADTQYIHTNQRFIFNGENRVWKIIGHNKYIMDNIDDDMASIFYFNVQLDEVSPYDDFENGIANNIEHQSIIGEQSTKQEEIVGEPYIKVSPYLESLTQGKSATLQVRFVDAQGNETDEKVYCNPSNANPSSYLLEDLGNNTFRLTNNKFDSKLLYLKFYHGDVFNNVVVRLKALF